MPWDLVSQAGSRYRLPASISPAQLHVGGAPDQRIVRGYGTSDWYTVLDGIRQPQPLELTGTLATDRNEITIQDLLNTLTIAATNAAALVQVTPDGTDVLHIATLGALPITTSPDGIDGTHLQVTVPLLPASDWQTGTPELGEYLLLDTGEIMLLDDGSQAIQQ